MLRHGSQALVASRCRVYEQNEPPTDNGFYERYGPNVLAILNHSSCFFKFYCTFNHSTSKYKIEDQHCHACRCFHPQRWLSSNAVFPLKSNSQSTAIIQILPALQSTLSINSLNAHLDLHFPHKHVQHQVSSVARARELLSWHSPSSEAISVLTHAFSTSSTKPR